jgi:signal transduction histidine kinase
MAAGEGVSLHTALSEGPLCVCGDWNCLTVVFDNLITNGIKYNRLGGKVTVSGWQSEGEVVVTVADTGVGIPEKYRPFLFDEFFRITDDGAKKTTGTGLGLHISKRIVSEMGGSLDFESQPGAGSTFRVRVPAWHEADNANTGSAE